MGLSGALTFSLALVSLTQIPVGAEGCRILSASPAGPSSILVTWEKYTGATNYFLDLRVKNNSSIAPVVVTLPASQTEKTVHGLRPGTEYSVTLKAFQFYFVVCVARSEASTVPDSSQITEGRALSSTSILLRWTEVPSAERYHLEVRSQDGSQAVDLTVNGSSAVVTDLSPFTNYDCYISTINGAGRGSRSKVRTVTTLMQPPLNVTAVQTGPDTARVTWQPVDGVLVYHVKIQDVDDPGARPSAHNVSGTRLDLHGILPCSTYLVSVSSFSWFLVPSEPTNHTYTTNKLTPVSTVSVDYSCTTDSVTVQWSAVLGADFYRASATADNGSELACTSQDTGCRISGLRCGQTFRVHVTPMSDNCKSMVNTTWATFQTAPCPPENLELLRQCSSEVVVFSWERTDNTDHYMARAVDSQGVVQECLTEDNSCYFTHTVCGRQYFFTVYSISGSCRSRISATVDTRTAPCIPQNVQTSADCNSNLLVSKWDHAEGALRYTVEAFGNKGDSRYNCSTLANSCAMEDVLCGEYLTIYITAFDDECSSPRTLGPVAETVPCTPHNVTAVKECGADSISMSWKVSGSSLFYVAMATDSQGSVHSCNTMDLTCKIDGLKCSTLYSARVISSNLMCNSSRSETVVIETAACPPDHVAASLDCAANEALISWRGETHINSYTAAVQDRDDGLLSCASASTSCKIPNLKCGRRYSVTVSHHDGICPSMPSLPVHMESVPCGPDVDARLDCRSRILTVSWNESSGADGYVATVASGGSSVSYNGTEPELRLDLADCGREYTLTVMSVSNSCVSHPSVFPGWKVPCVPTDLVAETNCGQSFLEVSWQASLGASYYEATAVHADGHRWSCVSNGTSCRLEGLMCSQVYDVAVAAGYDGCTSNESSAVTVQTAPCPPARPSVSVNCANNSAMMTWNSSPNAAFYTGKAVSADHHTVTCDAGIDLGCHFEGLHCGTEYTFTVAASDGDCLSADSAPVVRATAPCVVQNLTHTLSCARNALTVNWTPGSAPANYSVAAVSGDGAMLGCTSEGSGCTLTDLRCGERYSVSVLAVTSTCEGPSSVPEMVYAVPCVPANVQASVDCSSNTLWASWDAAAGASSYVSTLRGAGGFSASCPALNRSCVFPGLECAAAYTLSVAALNDGCNSSESEEVSVTSAPCEPTNVTAALDCVSGEATVTWWSGAGAEHHTVLAEAGGHADSCGSAGTSCVLARLQCGETYSVTLLAGDGTCNTSVRATTNITTAPCPPVLRIHSPDCVSDHAVVSWLEDEDATGGVKVDAASGSGRSVSCGSTADSSCVLSGLMCGSAYSIRAVASGAQCGSEASSPLHLQTAPCTPANLRHRHSCRTAVTHLSWDGIPGGGTFYARVVSGDHAASCSTNHTGCSLPSLLCGRTYDATVTAVSERCNGSSADVTRFTTAPCAPVNVSAALVCDNNTAAVRWERGLGAAWYNVTASGEDGDVKNCVTNDTGCRLADMRCAQTYAITVTPFYDDCVGFQSAPYAYIAGPCPPADVHVSMQCAGNVGRVTWTAAPRADHYEATAVASGPDDRRHECSSNGTSCTLEDLHCGRSAVVWVVAVERGCRSEASLPFGFRSVICPPANVSAVTSCSSNDITISWEPSPESGVAYAVRAREDGDDATYWTNETSYVIGGLGCGRLQRLTVAVKDAACTSEPSEVLAKETAPCPPTNLTVSAECGTNLGVLNWAASAGATSYTATVTGSHGPEVSCTSNSTACSVKLDCGHRYTAVVVASAATCDSSAGATVTFDSAPCLPDNVTAELHCQDNSLAVRWGRGAGEDGSYTAIAIGSDESRATCDSTSTDCVIRNLKCGLTYSIVVTTPSVNCDTIKGSDYVMQSAPCTPDNVLVDLQCSTNMALVTWENSGPDQYQVVTAADGRGATSNCSSAGSDCTFEQLACGESYVFGVVGHTNSCSSEPAVTQRINAAPCVPVHVTAQVDCKTGITVVTWDASWGAASYSVHAQGNLGHYAECNTNDTNCDFPYLACGQDYNITVVARHDTCTSLLSAPISATTVPCPHGGLQATMECDTNTVLMSWTPGNGIRYYNATADAFNVDHQETCFTDGSSCNISSLHCGESYKVSVSGRGLNCPSGAQDWHRVNTAPCPPTNLQVYSSCESNNISVWWLPSQGSLTYTAVAEDFNGGRWSCDTNTTTCQISGLLCGRRYRVYVAGVDGTCVGAKSNIEEIQTAPCEPQNIQNNLDCRSGVLNITWQSTGYAPYFYASVMSGEAHIRECNTDKRYCTVYDMQCGLTYNVTVTARDETCNSSHSPVTQVTTAPCPLASFLHTVDCDSGVAHVKWNDSVAGVLYTPWAVDAAGRRHNCSGADGSCYLSSLECGTDYNVTITPSRGGCIGRDSQAEMITTVPCVPHLSDVEIDCLTNSAWLTWGKAQGAESYVVMATDSQGDIQTIECTPTSDGSCYLPPLMCSQNFTFTVKAQDQQCMSGPSNPVTTETAPCPPEDIQKAVGCQNSTATISWAAVSGAVTYTATLEQMNGDTTCCTTSNTSCDITDLPCGEIFNLLVTAEGRTCNSSQGTGHFVWTVPCVPENLRASVDCADNVASMSWSYGNTGHIYTVKAIASDGHMDECTAMKNQCDLTGLRCGQQYTATVTAADSDCRSEPSQSATIRTVPCTPENVSSEVDCETNTLTVFWSESSGADSYLATVQDSDGQTTTCQGTTEGFCNITGLGCGQIYHGSVVSSDGYCNSPPTGVLNTPSVPCKPIHIMAVLDCYTQTATVTWYPSNGALAYVVEATTYGHNVTCDTNTTHCELDGLLCGQSYSVSVTAVGQTCSSMAYMTVQLVTEPCIPSHISVQYSLTIGQVLWDKTPGAEYYKVEAVTEQGLMVSCTTNDTYCALYQMECGQTYSINVTASNHVCQNLSTSTETAAIETEPCPPTNVQTSVNCPSNTGVVSWEASVGAVGYEAHLAGRDGHSLTCYTDDTSCEVEDLHCGIVYHVNVIAIAETLNSSLSSTVLLVSAPCAAGNVSVLLDCFNNSVEVSWDPASGAESYTVTAVSADGHQAWCRTDEHQCDLMDLQCSQTYNVSIAAVNDRCQSAIQTTTTFRTRPCKPLHVGVELQCGTSTASLYWEKREEVEFYMTSATSGGGMVLRHNSTNSTCQFLNLHCGEVYMFSVTAYSDMCYSEISNTVEIQTEPCQPADLVADGSCDNETVVLNWSAAEGASLYVVTATGDLGYTTAFQTNQTELEASLPCGQLFTFNVQAQDDRCNGPLSQPAVFKTGPCVPHHIQSFTHCEDSLGSVSWAQSDGAESYLAIAIGQDGHTNACTTNTTTCTWTDLRCGQVYTVYVVANDELCSSKPSNSTSIRMASCIPQNLQSSLNCTMKVGSLSWNASETADFYIVTAEAESGHKVQLSTNDSWTFISEFQCGEVYYLSVEAVDSECTSRPSEPAVLKSEPCPPTGVTSSTNCLSNIAVVMWSGSPGAEFYTATVTQENGQPQTCLSDMEQCGIPSVGCGQNYTVTVVATGESCDSDPSEINTLQSVPCVPTDVEVELDCSNNQAVVTWSPSNGALSYQVSAQDVEGAMVLCDSTESTCTLTNLTCGRSYSVQVVAEDDICSSLPSPAVQFYSVPCTPDIGGVVLDCITNSAFVDWAVSEGALHYMATAQSSGGHVSTCDSNYTHCELLDLLCGQTYNVITVASNGKCSSPPSTTLPVDTVPCRPENVVSTLECSSNMAYVSWQASMGANSYTVQAFGMEEHETGCETDSLSCVLNDLLCGFTYNISVTAWNSMCNVSQSEMQLLHAAPCEPQQVEARVVCESGAVAVSWEPSKGALSYTAVAQGLGGYASTCSSNETTCQLDDLLCGLNYSISVRASDDECDSAGSSAVELDTVPCIPQDVTAEMVCSTNMGLVSWEEGEGVSSYMVQAFGPNGHKAECNSTESTCELPSLHCGQLYNVTVTALDGRCDNSQAFLDLQSVPCRPTNVQAGLQCHSNSAAVTWEHASGAVSYLAVGVASDGSHRAECNNTMTHCDLSDLQCGQIYNVSVFSQDESCSSQESDVAYVWTAPCAPQAVAVDAQCTEDAMSVSWSLNPDVQYYHVAAVSNTGVRLYCNSTGTACTINNLPCGESYNVTVVSVRNGCESKPSAAVATSSAPCMAQNIVHSLDCVTNSVWVTWDTSEGATSYIVWAEGGGGHASSCNTTTSVCNVPDLKCATHYTFHVTAVNKYCSSDRSNTFDLETGPCALASINALTQCNSDTILVEWEMSNETPLYLVTAEGYNQTISCSSSNNSCELQDVRCDMQYSIIVSASSDKCSSLRSPPKKIKTAPCAPESVTAMESCKDSGAIVTWAHSPVATSYMLAATGTDGHVANCNTSVNNCTFADLHCGQAYDFSVTAIGDNCTSQPTTVSFRSVPCAPSSLTVDVECENNTAFLSWDTSEGAVEYFGCAQTMDGGLLYCDTTDTSCAIEGLTCGEVYNFSVEASDGICNSSFSPPLQEGAAPCAPTGLKSEVRRIVRTHWTMVSWDAVSCPSVEYLVEITGRIQDNPNALMSISSYWLPRPYFELQMPCSTAYNLTVRSRNSAGVSEPSSSLTGTTVPCAPQNVMYTGNNRAAVLSWDTAVFATSYSVYNISEEGRVRVCNTTGLSCQLADFDPDATEVTASNANGESLPNSNITGPVGNRRRRDLRSTQVHAGFEKDLAIPELVNVTVGGDSLYVQWTTVKDAAEYTLVIEEERGAERADLPPIVRTVEGDFYKETDLKPRTTYCVRLAAKNPIKQSSYCRPQCRTTRVSK